MTGPHYREGDTIVAPATPPGVGALAVVRISGPRALECAGQAFDGRTSPADAAPRTVLLGEIVGADGAAIDEVLLTIFHAPSSFTGENSVEISCHGAPCLVRRIVSRVLETGARLAGPGEFTRRAFLNGRIDLAQAESVADLVGAKTAGAARSALRQLHGELSGTLGALRGRLVGALADVEADLDFSAEEGVPPFAGEGAGRAVREARSEIDSLVERGTVGRIVRDGVRLVLAGRRNSGKSTLFNALLGEARAIVSPEPGTTRDVLEGDLEIGGILFRLSDTAGVHRGEVGRVEEEGMRRAASRREDADLILLVIDGSERLSGEDRRLLEESEGRNRVIAVSKLDLRRKAEKVPCLETEDLYELCALDGRGIDDLRGALLRAALGGREIGDPEVTSVRHLELLRSAGESLDSALQVLDRGELLAEDLRAAAAALGEITGEGAREELLDQIFERFCLGK